MINKKHNLSLKLNKSLVNMTSDAPFTPLDQTLKTPIDCNPQGNYFAGPPKQNSLYNHPSYNESDDILTDIDEPSMGGPKTTQNYTLNFTSNFDQLVMSVYSHILSLPTTTPFLGSIPPSGLVSRVANEAMNVLLLNTSSNNHPIYDQQSIINSDYLKNYTYQPIFLQLIRKRLIDLCTFQGSKVDGNANKLPTSTTITITTNAGSQNGAPYGNNARQSSISNLSLTDLNISNYNSNTNNNAMRSRSSSINLRKQSLTRNNSSTGGNWLHVGNINNIRQQGNHAVPMQSESMNASSESLQSMQDYVPQSFITRSAANTPTSATSTSAPNNGFNAMMMGYQTPPTSNKSSVSSGSFTSAGNPNQTIQIVHNQGGNSNEFDYFNFSESRSRSSSRSGNSLSGPLTINTNNANFQALSALNGESCDALDSPFMSATTPSEESGFFGQSNGFPTTPVDLNRDNDANGAISSGLKKDLSGQFGLSEKKRDSLKLKRGIH